MTIDIKAPKLVWNLRDNDSADTFFGPDFAESAPNVRPIWMDRYLEMNPYFVPTTSEDKVTYRHGAVPDRQMRRITGLGTTYRALVNKRVKLLEEGKTLEAEKVTAQIAGISGKGNLTISPLIPHTSENANGAWRWELPTGWDAIYRPDNFALDSEYNFAANKAVFLLRDGLTFRLTIEQAERYLAGEDLVVSRTYLATNRNGVKAKQVVVILAKLNVNRAAEWRPEDLAEQTGKDWHIALFETDEYPEFVPTAFNVVKAPVVPETPAATVKGATVAPVAAAIEVDDSPNARYERMLAKQRSGKR